MLGIEWQQEETAVQLAEVRALVASIKNFCRDVSLASTSATYDIYDTPTSAPAASSNDPETLSSMESILGHPTWIDLPIEMAATDIAGQLALVYFGLTVLQVPNLTGRNGRPANDIDVMTPVVIFACRFQNLEEALLWRHRRQVSAYPP